MQNVKPEGDCQITTYHDFKHQWNEAKAAGSPMLLLWKLKPTFSCLNQDDVAEWEECITNEVTNLEERRKEIAHMLKTIVEKYPTPQNYLKYFDTMGNDHNEILKALDECGSEYLHGQLVWNRFLENNDFGDLPLSILDMFRLRLRTPHRQIQETYESLSQWVSSNIPDSYNTVMRDASKLMNETEKAMRYLEKLEAGISESPNDAEPWIVYINKIAKFAAVEPREFQPIITFKSVKQLFLRSLFYKKGRLGDPAWLPVWNAYIRSFEKYLATNLKAYSESILEIYKTYPDKCDAFRPLLRNVKNEDEMIQVLRMMEECMELKNTSDFNSWLITVEDILGSCRRVSSNLILPSLMKYGEIAATNQLDNEHILFKEIVTILEELGTEESLKVAKGLIVDFFESFAMQTESWIFCFRFFARYSEKHVKKLLTLWDQDALEIDNPKRLLEEILRYVRLHGSTNDYIDAMNKADKLEDKVVLEKNIPSKDAIESSSTKLDSEKKRVKTEPQIDAPIRSREQFRIRMMPVTDGVTEKDIRQFFQGYGEPVSITIVESMAVVEFHSEQEVMTCLTRDVKPLNGEPVKISRLFANTLWITNYPPEFDFEEIKDLVNSFGKAAIDIRLPSQADLKQRRFCYVDFADPESAQHVRNELNGFKINNYEVQAEISNPTLKKERRDPPISRQVYLHNLNFKETTEQSLRECLGKFGDIEAIKLPLNETNKSRGNVNNGYGFVTFTTDIAAKEAISLGGAQLDGRRIEISSVKSKQKLQKLHVSQFKADLSVSIQNVNEVVTSEQLKLFLEQKVGPVSKILLQPSKKAALVEFESFKDAGKVGLILEGVDYESSILHIGLKDDFVKMNPGVSAPKMVPSVLMSRRKR